jgi:hypothetical protein
MSFYDMLDHLTSTTGVEDPSDNDGDAIAFATDKSILNYSKKGKAVTKERVAIKKDCLLYAQASAT